MTQSTHSTLLHLLLLLHLFGKMKDCDKSKTDDCEWYFTVEFIKVYIMGITIIVVIMIIWAVYDLVKWLWPKPRAVWLPPIQYSPYIPRKMPPVPRDAIKPFKIEAIEPADLGVNNEDIAYIDETDHSDLSTSNSFSDATTDIVDSDL